MPIPANHITREKLESLSDPPGTESAQRTKGMIRSLESLLLDDNPSLTKGQRRKAERWIQILIRRAMNQTQAHDLKSKQSRTTSAQQNTIPTQPPLPLVVNLIPVKHQDGSHSVIIRYPDIPSRVQRHEERQARGGTIDYQIPRIHQLPVNLKTIKRLQTQLSACENGDTDEAHLLRKRIRQIKDMLGIPR